MTLTEQINQDIKTAMKAKDREKLEALRAIKTALLLEATKGGAGNEIDEATGLKILQKLHKQRVESAGIYREQNRADLAETEEMQADVIAAYLPQPISDAELTEAIKTIIGQMGASGMGDMGKVMGAATKALAGKADGKVISAKVKALLG